jgi:hypothetical protein
VAIPFICTKYGRSIAEWQQIIGGCGLEKHMEIVGYLKSEYGMGHGHANALVGWTLTGNVAYRTEARAKRRLATLAQAINKISATTARRIQVTGRSIARK